MLKEYLNEQTIILQANATDKEDAIRQAAMPLVKLNKITEGYITQMIDAINEYGPYMVILPGVALAHGKPSENVKEECISLLTLKEPVVFGHASNDPVNIIFVIASPSSDQHLEVLVDVSTLLLNPEFSEILNKTSDVKELFKFF